MSLMIRDNRKSVLNLIMKRKVGVHNTQTKKDVDYGMLAQKLDVSEKDLWVAFEQHVRTEQDIIEISSELYRLTELISGRDRQKK